MARLLATEVSGARIDRWWLHNGEDGKDRITVETIEDVEPVFKAVQAHRDRPKSKDFRHVASIPLTVIDEICRLNATIWGVKPARVFAELMDAKTDRAKSIWRMLSQGRDYAKFQSGR